MDAISHALWAGALAKAINLNHNLKKKINFWWFAFFGMFPDIIAFAIPYIIWFFGLIFGVYKLSDAYLNLAHPTTIDFPYYNLVSQLYYVSHSLIIFALVFLILFLIFKKPIWIMFGWLLHIVIDIFTHVRSHYTTPILWPVSNFTIGGIVYWRETWFLIADVVLLIIVYGILSWLEKKGKNSHQSFPSSNSRSRMEFSRVNSHRPPASKHKKKVKKK